jgi:CBS domain containing-hemolysin-like protein
MNHDTPLPHRRLRTGVSIAQTQPWAGDPVTLDSPALAVMTDLTKIKAATIQPNVSLKEAEWHMVYLGVHMLFVVSEMPALEGLITSTDIRGERPVHHIRERGVQFDDLTVADVMTERSNLEAIDFDKVMKSTVSNVIATLKSCGRNHLLVTDTSPIGAVRARGVISRSQVARQIGEQIHLPGVVSDFVDLVRILA